jgi:hypothetical protein
VKHSVRKVTFTPEEMAYDLPDDTSHFVPVKRAGGNLFAKPTKEEIRSHQRKIAASKNAKLEPEVRKAFPDDQALNDLLKAFLRIAKSATGSKRKRSA